MSGGGLASPTADMAGRGDAVRLHESDGAGPAGEILGRPKITYESEQATDSDRLAYRVAVMEALQRCTPMPFTETMAGAVAGRPFAVQFRNRKSPPKPIEKRAWLTPKTL